MRIGDKVRLKDKTTVEGVVIGVIRKMKDSTIRIVFENVDGDLLIAHPEELEVILKGIHGGITHG